MKLVFALLLSLPLLAGAKPKLPADVAKFIDNAEMCEATSSADIFGLCTHH